MIFELMAISSCGARTGSGLGLRCSCWRDMTRRQTSLGLAIRMTSLGEAAGLAPRMREIGVNLTERVPAGGSVAQRRLRGEALVARRRLPRGEAQTKNAQG